MAGGLDTFPSGPIPFEPPTHSLTLRLGPYQWGKGPELQLDGILKTFAIDTSGPLSRLTVEMVIGAFHNDYEADLLRRWFAPGPTRTGS